MVFVDVDVILVEGFCVFELVEVLVVECLVDGGVVVVVG